MQLVQNLDDVLILLWRRKAMIFATSLVCSLVALWYISDTRKVYVAEAAIQVEGPQVQNPALAAGAASNAAQIMQSIEQRLLTRENMLAVVDRHGLYAEEDGYTDDDRVAALRNSISFKTVAGVPGPFGGPPSISAILISSRMGDPELAARIANDLAQSVLDMSKEGAAARTSDTYAFFAGEEDRIRNEIVSQEARIAAFQNDNEDNLPLLADARRQELRDLDVQLRSLDQSNLELEAEKLRLEEQGVQRETDRRRQEELVTALELIKDKQKFAEARRAEVEDSLADMPEVEQAIAAQRRELILLQDRYASISQSLADAQTALFLAERQQSERFMLLDRAVTPESSISPGRRKLLAAAAAASIVIGIVLAILAELAFPIVRSSSQLERAMGVPALGSIPEVRELSRRASGLAGMSRGEFTFWNVAGIAALAVLIWLISTGIT